MDKERMKPIEITIKHKKNQLIGRIAQVAIFLPFKVVEVNMLLTDDTYFLIFYKDDFVYGDRLEKVSAGSFIDLAFQKGIVLPSHHPFLPVMIPHKSTTIPNGQTLFSKLQARYSLLEMAYLATTFDSFITKDQLIKTMDKIYFHYRRNGSFFKAYQILRVLMNFSPEYHSAHERLQAQKFSSYMKWYHTSPLSLIYEKDPLFVELYNFNNRMNPEVYEPYIHLLNEHGRSVELLLLWMEKVAMGQETDSFDHYTSLALQFVSMEGWMAVLTDINVNPFQRFPEAKKVIQKMMSEKRYESAASYLFRFIDDLPASYEDLLNDLWLHLDPEFAAAHLDDVLSVLQKLASRAELGSFEQTLLLLTRKLLQSNSLPAVYEKLKPIHELIPNSPVLKKLKRMMLLIEDPDHMMELGQYYAEFKQFDEAIECFAWEMELHPEDSAPVRELSKMYHFKGMDEEASAYQQIYTQIKKDQGVG